MKFFVIVVAVSCLAFTAKHAEVPHLSPRFRTALLLKETRGCKNPPDYVIADKKRRNKAYGCYGIRQPYVDDVNDHFGSSYKAENCLGHREVSDDLLEKFQSIYATSEWLGHEPTIWDGFCLQNGGPYGPFDGGAIDCQGTLHPNLKTRKRIADCQARAKAYARSAMAIYVSLSE